MINVHGEEHLAYSKRIEKVSAGHETNVNCAKRLNVPTYEYLI